eukprot:CAMPEP_0113559530 /NCGR_PEP_ID=MMETSP0015_2-20120614/18946_1 /TAXON_ID=2838 /ORGANISM="Odontella" /LENGTH=173 /DNA_ID=CAMNT_0000461173 /DNA_START=221 /DNA_END=738 /DNA_ORIENTATION=+ /assembly_acc=CAM_ASM_000160
MAAASASVTVPPVPFGLAGVVSVQVAMMVATSTVSVSYVPIPTSASLVLVLVPPLVKQELGHIPDDVPRGGTPQRRPAATHSGRRGATPARGSHPVFTLAAPRGGGRPSNGYGQRPVWVALLLDAPMGWAAVTLQAAAPPSGVAGVPSPLRPRFHRAGACQGTRHGAADRGAA